MAGHGMSWHHHGYTVPFHIPYILTWIQHHFDMDALGFEKGKGPVFSYEDTDAVILHSKLAAAVIDTMLSMQKAVSATRLRSC